MNLIRAEIYCDRLRKYPIYNGYRPAFDFGLPDTLLSGEIILDDRGKVLQGQMALGFIKLLSPELIESKIKYGKKYFFYEGPPSSKPTGFLILLEK